LLRQAGFTPEEALRPAPSFELHDTASGASIALSKLTGKFVLVTFWGTGCVHCIKEFPRLERLAQHPDGKDIAIVCICADETDTAAVEAAARKAAGTLAVCVDPKGLAPVRYEVQAVPTVVLIDPHGRLLGRAQGVPDLTATAFHSIIKGRQQD
jgi:thiol-disulfide isomerase/thioredoxin